MYIIKLDLITSSDQNWKGAGNSLSCGLLRQDLRVCFARARWVFVLRGGGMGGELAEGGRRTKTHLARLRHHLKSCTKDHLYTSILAEGVREQKSTSHDQNTTSILHQRDHL